MSNTGKKATSTLDFLALAISVLAAIIAVIMPYITYKWMQDDVRIQRMKASSLRAVSGGASSASRAEDGSVSINKSLFVRITNDGELPVGQVEVILEYNGFDEVEKDLFKDTKVKAEPYREVLGKLCDFGSCVEFVATLEKPLPPSEVVELVFTDIKPKYGLSGQILAWVRSEASPAVPVQGLPGRKK